MEKNEQLNVPIWQKVTLTVEEAIAYSNIGENKLRELINEPSCTFVLLIGKRKLVKRKEFEEFLSKRMAI